MRKVLYVISIIVALAMVSCLGNATKKEVKDDATKTTVVDAKCGDEACAKTCAEKKACGDKKECADKKECGDKKACDKPCGDKKACADKKVAPKKACGDKCGDKKCGDKK